MNFYTRAPPTPINNYAYYDSYKNLVDNNASTIPTPFLYKKDLIPTHIFPEYGILDVYNRKSYFHNSFPNTKANPNVAYLHQSYPAYFPELDNLNAGATADYGLANSSIGRTIGNITY